MWSVVVFALTAQALAQPVAGQALVPAGPWTGLSRDDGIVMQTRPIIGTPFLEFQAVVEMPVSATQMLDLLWGDGSRRETSPSVTRSELLEDTPDRRISYEVAAAPIVSPRDYVLLTTRHRDEGAIRFHTVVDARRPVQDGIVRIPRIVGSTVVSAIDDGRCRVVHTVFAEAGGNVPAWLARNGQRDNMVARLKALRARAAASRPAR